MKSKPLFSNATPLERAALRLDTLGWRAWTTYGRAFCIDCYQQEVGPTLDPPFFKLITAEEIEKAGAVITCEYCGNEITDLSK